MLALFAINKNQVADDAFARGLIISVIGMAILYGLILIIVRDRHRAGWIASALAVIFFSYGHIATALSDQQIAVTPSALVITSALIALLSTIALSRIKHPERSTSPLNVIALILIAFPIYQIISADVQRAWARSARQQTAAKALSPDAPRPDIYYIIMDSYGRSDLLREAYAYDNSAFIGKLESLGFVIAQCSQSNYQRTEVSLGSILNLDYLQTLDPSFEGADNMPSYLLWEKLKHNEVRRTLEDAGYVTITYATGFDWLEIRDADYYIQPSAVGSQVTPFEALFLRTTLLREAEAQGWIDLAQDEAAQARARTLTTLNSIDQVLQIESPKFVYMHLVSPHPPFVFNSDGSPFDDKRLQNENGKYTSANYKKGYVAQAQFVTAQVVNVIEKILAASSEPPVIIVQGDHAPWIQSEKRKFEILNAFYIPGHESLIYPSISSVNTFRVIFNAYFGAEYPLLEDRSYYSPAPYAFLFHEVKTSCSNALPESEDSQ